ncbi:MAG: hypothetical protein ACO1O6_09540 [Bacteroidota bacterium]
MRSALHILFILVASVASGQDSVSWKKDFELPVSGNAGWAIDNFNNVYIAEKDLIVKIDPSGKQLFEQSLKKYGQIKTIDARNPLKILIFSEQQQSIFYLDNTLSKQENDIDLSDFDLSYVTMVSASSQMDKIWTFDQDNSKIKLLTQNKAQIIQLENTAGILEMTHLRQFFEQSDRLFVIDSLKGIYQFDIYGTLIQFLPEENISWAAVSGEYLYLLKNRQIEILNLATLNKKTIALPTAEKVTEFAVNQNTLFFRTPDKLLKFSISAF